MTRIYETDLVILHFHRTPARNGQLKPNHILFRKLITHFSAPSLSLSSHLYIHLLDNIQDLLLDNGQSFSTGLPLRPIGQMIVALLYVISANHLHWVQLKQDKLCFAFKHPVLNQNGYMKTIIIRKYQVLHEQKNITD